jgi:hypothetical protein
VNAAGGPESNAALLFTAANFLTGQDLVDAILRERAVELGAEGQRLHDLKRLEQNFTGLGGAISWNADKLVLPIPQTEIDANSNIVPNPGY